MAGFKAIAEAPRFLSRQDADVAQQSTPGSFAALPPLLRLELEQVRIYLCPPPDSLPTCFSKYESTSAAGQHANPDGEDEDLDHDAAQTVVADGKLWLTESELSFLAPGSSSGFSVTYPTISLHAVTRSPPAGLAAPCPPSASASQQNGQDPRSGGCLYVQLDLAAEDEQADQDDEGSLLEMHVFTPDDESRGYPSLGCSRSARPPPTTRLIAPPPCSPIRLRHTVDQLFEALSHCASLHPSAGGGGDGGSHPFSGFAPFGTGDPDAMAVDGAFDDADEDDDAIVADAQPTNGDGAGTAELSEAGRVRNDFQTPDSRFRPY
ncbi:uncharacterized protein PSFLO_05807 [Pseudozyma flocculosa]|uniref:Regulator of volume decrease after cellular swelling-domain-containing protein n=1 Tax=Pseudozyma flocculosa TaxID=84751 RepID=A0A5C3F9K8_9BASI|nr:uncharacterized protein PSFLO_05807 [Pseudozyma flocculosa]